MNKIFASLALLCFFNFAEAREKPKEINELKLDSFVHYAIENPIL